MPYSSDVWNDDVRRVLRGLKPNARVLDIGAGAGKYGRMAREERDDIGHLIAVEPTEKYIEQFGLRDVYDEISTEDALNFLEGAAQHYDDYRFDLAILGDVLEHLRFSDGVDLLQMLSYRAADIVVLTPPDCPQWFGPNNFENHRSSWETADFNRWRILYAGKRADVPLGVHILFIHMKGLFDGP